MKTPGIGEGFRRGATEEDGVESLALDSRAGRAQEQNEALVIPIVRGIDDTARYAGPQQEARAGGKKPEERKEKTKKPKEAKGPETQRPLVARSKEGIIGKTKEFFLNILRPIKNFFDEKIKAVKERLLAVKQALLDAWHGVKNFWHASAHEKTKIVARAAFILIPTALAALAAFSAAHLPSITFLAWLAGFLAPISAASPLALALFAVFAAREILKTEQRVKEGTIRIPLNKQGFVNQAERFEKFVEQGVAERVSSGVVETRSFKVGTTNNQEVKEKGIESFTIEKRTQDGADKAAITVRFIYTNGPGESRPETLSFNSDQEMRANPFMSKLLLPMYTTLTFTGSEKYYQVVYSSKKDSSEKMGIHGEPLNIARVTLQLPIGKKGNDGKDVALPKDGAGFAEFTLVPTEGGIANPARKEKDIPGALVDGAFNLIGSLFSKNKKEKKVKSDQRYRNILEN